MKRITIDEALKRVEEIKPHIFIKCKYYREITSRCYNSYLTTEGCLLKWHLGYNCSIAVCYGDVRECDITRENYEKAEKVKEI